MPGERPRVEHLYHDYSIVAESETIAQCSSPPTNTNFSFVEKLHYLLSDMENEQLDHIVGWQPHGRCFVVRRPDLLETKILPVWFRQKKFASFQRQLNLYGFNRITSGLTLSVKGLDKKGYYHECFLRGKPVLAKLIHRMKVKRNGGRKASSPLSEPKFYDMPCLPSSLAEEPRVTLQTGASRISSTLTNSYDLSSRVHTGLVPSNLQTRPQVSANQQNLTPQQSVLFRAGNTLASVTPTTQLQQPSLPTGPLPCRTTQQVQVVPHSQTAPTISVGSAPGTLNPYQQTSAAQSSGVVSPAFITQQGALIPGHTHFPVTVPQHVSASVVPQQVLTNQQHLTPQQSVLLLAQLGNILASVTPTTQLQKSSLPTGPLPSRTTQQTASAMSVGNAPGTLNQQTSAAQSSGVASPVSFTPQGALIPGHTHLPVTVPQHVSAAVIPQQVLTNQQHLTPQQSVLLLAQLGTILASVTPTTHLQKSSLPTGPLPCSTKQQVQVVPHSQTAPTMSVGSAPGTLNPYQQTSAVQSSGVVSPASITPQGALIPGHTHFPVTMPQHVSAAVVPQQVLTNQQNLTPQQNVLFRAGNTLASVTPTTQLQQPSLPTGPLPCRTTQQVQVVPHSQTAPTMSVGSAPGTLNPYQQTSAAQSSGVVSPASITQQGALIPGHTHFPVTVPQHVSAAVVPQQVLTNQQHLTPQQSVLLLAQLGNILASATPTTQQQQPSLPTGPLPFSTKQQVQVVPHSQTAPTMSSGSASDS